MKIDTLINKTPVTIRHNPQAISVCLLIFITVSALWVWGFNTHDFNRRDAFDYAQLSRQVYQGKGLSTQQIFPRHVPYFQAKGLLAGDNWPNLYRNPLITVTGAAFQWFFDSVIVAMVIQSGFWYLVSIPILFFLAKGVATLEVATLSTIFFVADPVIFLYSYSGMTETLGTFLLLSFFALIFIGTPKTWRWPLLGIVSVLAYLARTQFIVLIPLAFALGWFGAPEGKRNSVIWFLFAGVAIVLTPWIIRNLEITGDPLFSFTTTRNLVLDAVPGHSDLEMQLHAPVDLQTILSEYGRDVAAKFVRNAAANIVSPLYWANTFRHMLVLLPLFAFAGLITGLKFSQQRYNFFRWSTVALILATFLLTSITVYSVRSYVMFRPLVLVMAASALVSFLDTISGPRFVRTAILGLLILLAGFQLLSSALIHKNRPPTISQFDLRAYEILARRTSEDSLIASDISEQISLLTDRPTLRLPADPAELLEIDRSYISVDYVALGKDLAAGGSAQEGEPGYHETYQDYLEFIASSQFLDVYQLQGRLPNGALLYRKIRN